MRKQLSMSLALVLAVACKTDPPASSTSSDPPAGSTTRARSAKVDVKPVQPALPAGSDQGTDQGSDHGTDAPHGDRGEWRKRRDAKLDTDGDGVVSDEERAAAMKRRMTAMHDRLDADGDGKLTPAELGAATGRLHFDDPAAVDTNHDGEISADELAAAVKARRDARRAARNGSGQAADPTTE